MLQKIEIQGLSFIQVDIFGCYLPSSDSIESVLVKIRDKRKKRKVCECSNKIVPILYKNYELPVHSLNAAVDIIVTENKLTGKISLDDIDKILLAITGLQCELSGDNLEGYIREEFTVRWFESLLGDFNLDTKKLRAVSANILKPISENKKHSEKFGLEPEIPSPNMSQYPDYIQSKLRIQEFDCRVQQISCYDKRMFLLTMASIEIMNIFFKVSERSITTTHKIFCSECQNYFTTNRRPISKLCNPCQEKLKEEKKVGRRKPRNGWVADRLGDCNQCENKRRINTLGSCLKCYRENH